MQVSLGRRVVAEALGTALLLAAVVGSGIMGERLASGNVAIALLANTIATGAALVALILTFGPVSGAHFNPAVTLADAWLGGLPWGRSATGLVPRLADVRDATAIARIYNEGIEDRIATFETELRDEAAVQQWFTGRYPIVVVEKAGEVVAFASSSSSSGLCRYAGNADFGVYVARSERGQGAGAAAMRCLIEQARARGLTKLLSGVFPENGASLGLLRKLGFREVGRYEKHGKLVGIWRDVVIVELVL